MFPLFLCLFFMYFLKSIIKLLQSSIIYCVSWVPRLTVLDL